ncbi:MAG: hypothetical protein K6E29_07255, partial [Cyanobacteria bacterium RUI128]|nr:hypothetical protein [Cyanobacteria bacterium RUI128]
SSSQARLLNLTARMHQIEYKAAKLEAQKLQMANESRRVYDTYLQALEANKVQFATLTSKGSIDYADASLSALENSIINDTSLLTSAKAYLLQNTETNQIYISDKVAKALHISETGVAPLGTKEQYLNEHGVYQVKEMVDAPDPTNIIGTPQPVTNIFTAGSGASTPTTYAYNITSGSIATPDTSASTPAYTDYSENLIGGTVPNIQNIQAYNPGSSGNFINPVTTKNTVPAGYIGIYTAEQLASVSAMNNYILMNDIDLSGRDWTPISALVGTFDGNGHKITGANHAIFDYLTGYAVVQNLGIESDNLEDCAFLSRYASDQVSINNCYITGTNNSINAWTNGGFIGGQPASSDLILSVSDSYIDMVYTSNYGIFGIMGIQSSTPGVTNITINNYYQNIDYGTAWYGIVANESAVITASNVHEDELPTIAPVGATMGIYELPDDYSIVDFLKFKAYEANGSTGSPDDYTISANGEVDYDIDSYDLACLLDCYYYSEDYQGHLLLDIIQGNDLDGWTGHIDPSHYTLSQNSDYEYSYSSNPHAAVNKVTVSSENDIINSLAVGVHTALGAAAEQNQLSVYADRIRNNFTEAELASLSQYMRFGASTIEQICSYLAQNDGACSKGSIPSIFNINLYSGYTISHYSNSITINETVTPGTTGSNDKITIPLTSEIASNLVVAFRKAGKTVSDESAVASKLASAYGSDLAKLAVINEQAAPATQSGTLTTLLNDLYSYLCGSGSAPSVTPAAGTYDYAQVSQGNCQVQYGTTPQWTGNWVWDTTDPDYIRYSQEYDNLLILQNSTVTYKIIDDSLAEDPEYLNNLFANGAFVLIDYSKGLGDDMTHTSVSVETNLREVEDETNLRKAEAKYEADMRKIDHKDRRYDTELAALDAERNAIKSEMETLKTVAKDNVERTFKLFS